MNRKIVSIGLLSLVLAACGSSAAANSSSTANSSKSATSTVPSNQSKSGSGTELSSTTSKYGDILSSPSGRVYYMFVPDSATNSTCYSSCAPVWPAVTTTNGNVTTAKGVSKSLVTIISRTDGTKQIVYNGHPLYTFTGDNSAGMTSGEGVNSYGGYWYVLNVKGKVVKAPISSNASSSNTTAPASPY